MEESTQKKNKQTIISNVEMVNVFVQLNEKQFNKSLPLNSNWRRVFGLLSKYLSVFFLFFIFVFLHNFALFSPETLGKWDGYGNMIYGLWPLYFCILFGSFPLFAFAKKSFFGIDPLCNRRNSVVIFLQTTTTLLLSNSNVFSVMQIFVSSQYSMFCCC